MSGEVLHMQLIYKRKTNGSLPAGYILTYNEKHWKNEKES